MNEQEIRDRIDTCERQIVRSFQSLRSAAQELGANSSYAAAEAKNYALQEISSQKKMNTLWPIILIVLGFCALGSAVLVGLIMMIGGGMLISHLRGSASAEEARINREYGALAEQAEKQRSQLNAVLDENRTI